MLMRSALESLFGCCQAVMVIVRSITNNFIHVVAFTIRPDFIGNFDIHYSAPNC
jgi:hypothetical protein